MKKTQVILLVLCVAIVIGGLLLLKRKSFYAPPRDQTTELPFIEPSGNVVDTSTQSNVFQDMDGFVSTRENPMSKYFQGPDLFTKVQRAGESCIDPILEPFANVTSNMLIYGYSAECTYPFTEPTERVEYTQTDVYNDTAGWPNKYETPLSNVVTSESSFVGLESSAGVAPMTVIPSDEQYAYAHPMMTATAQTHPTYVSSLTSYDIPFIGATPLASSPSPTGSPR